MQEIGDKKAGRNINCFGEDSQLRKAQSSQGMVQLTHEGLAVIKRTLTLDARAEAPLAGAETNGPSGDRLAGLTQCSFLMMALIGYPIDWIASLYM